MKIIGLVILSLSFAGLSRAQLNLYSVKQLGTGKRMRDGKISAITWLPSDAKLSIDLDNRSIYIYNKGVTQHINLIKEISKPKIPNNNSVDYSAVDDNGLPFTISVTDRNNPVRLHVFSTDSLVAVYKIAKEKLKE